MIHYSFHRTGGIGTVIAEPGFQLGYSNNNVVRDSDSGEEEEEGEDDDNFSSDEEPMKVPLPNLTPIVSSCM